MIPSRAPGTVWALRRDFASWVRTLHNERIEIVMPPAYGEGSGRQRLVVSRQDARLLAKRINQCLDGTAKP